MTYPPVAQDRKCGAKAKSTGKQCGRWAIPGGTVCASHGGNARQVRDAANERVLTKQLRADAEATVAHLGLEPIGDPLDQLSLLAQESRAMLTALGNRVNALDDLDELNNENTPHLKIVVGLYERALDRTHRLLDSLVKHGYTERQIQLQESEAMLVAGVIRRTLAGLGLTPEQVDTANTLLSEEFRQLAQAGDLI